MLVRAKILLIAVIGFSSISCVAQMTDKLDLYLLVGQSNMAGRGEVKGKYITQGDEHVYMLDKDNKWVKAKNPLHFDKPSVAGVGPGMSFGLEMAKANPKAMIGLVPCAVGGTSINSWKPGGYDKATKTHPYDDALVRIREAMKSGVFKGIIWHQGESDSSPDSAALYYPKLAELLSRFRDVIQNSSLPVVVGELGTFKTQYLNINKVLEDFISREKNVALASSKGLIHKGDETHFDAESAEIFGKRFASEMKKLQKKNRKQI